MRVLVTGASGLLGAHLVAGLSRQHEVVGLDRHPWWGDRPAQLIQGDLSDLGFLSEVFSKVDPEVFIHCAAMGNVDACEQNPDLAYASNRDLTRNLVRAVPPSCLFVYISTDGIFGGDSPFCTEDQLPSPRTVYGRSKLLGEEEVRQATDRHLIVRTNFYGWSSGRKKTFAEWLYSALEKQEEITLFEDFFFTPLYVVDFVTRLSRLMETGHRGVFHLCGKERVSKSQFGTLLAEAAGFSMERVRRASMEQAPWAAPRPKDISLDSSRLCRLTGMTLPSLREGLTRFLNDREKGLSRRFDGRMDLSNPATVSVKEAGR